MLCEQNLVIYVESDPNRQPVNVSARVRLAPVIDITCPCSREMNQLPHMYV
jgi:hypothetical protein